MNCLRRLERHNAHAEMARERFQAGIKFYCKSKDVNRHNTFDQARIGTLGIKPRYVTEVFVDKENADMALHIIHTLS